MFNESVNDSLTDSELFNIEGGRWDFENFVADRFRAITPCRPAATFSDRRTRYRMFFRAAHSTPSSGRRTR